MLLVFSSTLSTVNVVLPSRLPVSVWTLWFDILLPSEAFPFTSLGYSQSLLLFMGQSVSPFMMNCHFRLLFSFYYLEVFAFLWVLLPYSFGFPWPLRNQVNLLVLPVHFLHHTSEGELKSLLMREKEESEKGGLTQHSKNKDPVIRSHHFMANRWENNGNSETLYFLGLQNHCRWWLQP